MVKFEIPTETPMVIHTAISLPLTILIMIDTLKCLDTYDLEKETLKIIKKSKKP